jgi:C-methyltransferase
VPDVGRTPSEVVVAAGAFRLAAAIRAAAALGLGEALDDKPRSPEAIAAAVAADLGSLTGLLRALASEGVIDEPEPDRFTLGEGGPALRPAAAGGFRELILGWAGHPGVYRALERLDEGVRTGRPSFELVHGSGFFDHLADHPEEERLYQVAVGGEDPEEFAPYLDVVDLDGCAVVVDVGGGGGGFVRALLDRWPQVRAVVAELPSVADHTRRRIAETDHTARIDVVAADARVGPLPSGDCYLFSTVLRYFPDDVAVAVLGHVVAAATPGASVVLVEMPIADGAARAPAAMKSLVEQALTGGRDRTVPELEALLQRAGFGDVDAVLVTDPFWIIRGRL